MLTHITCNADIGDITVKGYLSQGYINTSGNNYLGNNQGGSFDFGEAGFNLYYRPIDRMYFSAQLISRNMGDYASGEDDLKLDYGLIGFNLVSSNVYDLNLRVGRFKYSYGLLNDIQDISVATPGILAPQIMYFDYILNTLSVDGIQIEQNVRFDDIGSFRFDLLYGKHIDEDDKENKLLIDFIENTKPYSTGATGEVSSYDGVGSMRLMYFSADNSLLLGYTRTFYDGTTTLYASNSYFSYNNIIDGSSDTFSFEYISDKWTLTGEYHSIFSKNDSKLSSVFWSSDAVEKREIRSEGYYLQFAYQLRHDFETIVRYEAYFSNKSDRDGFKWAKTAGDPFKDYYRYSKDLIIGATYDINDSFTLKSEFHVVDGAALNFAALSIGAPEFDINEGLDRYWNMFLLELTYSF